MIAMGNGRISRIGSDHLDGKQAGVRRHVDAVQQLARFGRVKYRRLARCHDVAGPAHRVRRVGRLDLAVEEPVERWRTISSTGHHSSA